MHLKILVATQPNFNCCAGSPLNPIISFWLCNTWTFDLDVEHGSQKTVSWFNASAHSNCLYCMQYSFKGFVVGPQKRRPSFLPCHGYCTQHGETTASSLRGNHNAQGNNIQHYRMLWAGNKSYSQQGPCKACRSRCLRKGERRLKTSFRCSGKEKILGVGKCI